MIERAYTSIDLEEWELMEAIEKDEWAPIEDPLMAEKAKAQAAAKNTVTRNNLRVYRRSSQAMGVMPI